MGFIVLAAGFLGRALGLASPDRRLHEVITNPIFVTGDAQPGPQVLYDRLLNTYYTATSRPTTKTP